MQDRTLSTSLDPTTRDLCAKLQSACDLRSEPDFVHYSEAIEALSSHPSEEVLRVMFDCLRDVEGGEVQYELVEACEAYPTLLYTRVLVQVAATVSKRSPIWFRLMFQSAVNHGPTRKQFVAATRAAPSDQRRAVQELASILVHENPEDARYVAFHRAISRNHGTA